jgi:hypothetical protein
MIEGKADFAMDAGFFTITATVKKNKAAFPR